MSSRSEGQRRSIGASVCATRILLSQTSHNHCTRFEPLNFYEKWSEKFVMSYHLQVFYLPARGRRPTLCENHSSFASEHDFHITLQRQRHRRPPLRPIMARRGIGVGNFGLADKKNRKRLKVGFGFSDAADVVHTDTARKMENGIKIGKRMIPMKARSESEKRGIKLSIQKRCK